MPTILTVSADTEYTDASTWDGNHNYNFQSVDEFVSYCHWYAIDTTFASDHKNDLISISLTNSDFTNDFPGLGSSAYPFEGTVTFADTTSLTITTNRAFFSYLSDKASIVGSGGSTAFTLIINRTSDVADNTSAPLLADHVVHYTGNPEDENDNEVTAAKGWKVQVTGTSTFSGAIGEIGKDALVDLTFTNNTGKDIKSNAANEAGAVPDVGLFCGSMGSDSAFTVKYISSNAISHKTTSANGNAGTFVGTMGAGATLNVISDITTISSEVTAGGAEADNKGYAGGLVGDMDPTAVVQLKATAAGNANRNLSTLSIGGSVIGNNGAGGLYGRYGFNSAASLNLNDYNTTATVSGKYCGGLFGVLETSGGLTLSSSNTAKTYATTSNGKDDGCFGGVIGKLTAENLTDTILLQNLKVSPTANASFGSFGGVIGIVDSAAYVQVDSVEVNASGMAQRQAADFFGGLVGTTSSTNGVFIDLGNFKLTANGYYGGGVVGKFNKGVLRLTETTNMTNAKPAGTAASTATNGQLVGVNDNVLVYTPGGWTYSRSSGSYADDLGTWGEVVRLAGIETNILTFNSTAHTVTVSSAVQAMSSQNDLVKTALNMQLDSCGCLIMPSTRIAMYSTNLSLSDDISFAGTGITGLMRDGGQLSTIGNYTAVFDGNDHKITLAIGEKYGNGITAGSTAEGIGQIYRHQYNGLFSVLGGTVSNLTIDGTIDVHNCVDGMNIGGIAACNGGNVTLTKIAANETINYHEGASVGGTEAAGKNVGGLIGFVGTNGDITINGVSSIGATLNLSGNHQDWSVYGGAIGKVTAETFTIEIGEADEAANKLTIGMTTNVTNTTTVGSNSDCGGLIGHITNAGSYGSRIVNINNLIFDDVTVNEVTKTPTIGNAATTNGGGFLGYSWLNSTVNINGLTVTKGIIDNHTKNGAVGGNSNIGVMCYEATGRWNVDKLTVTNMTMSNGGGDSVGMLVNKAFKGDDGLYLNVLNSGYTLTAATLPSLAKFDELAAYSAASADAVIAGGDGVGVVSINMNAARTGTTNSRISTRTVGETTTVGTGTYQNQLTGITCSQTSKFANSTTRYYYNLDVMGNTDGGENLTLWSVKKYAPTNLKSEFVTTIADNNISGTANLTGLSFYPLAKADGYTIRNLALTFDYSGIYTSAETIYNATYNKNDSYIRDPGATVVTSGETTTDNRNQHYLMHSGLFIDSSADTSLTVSGALSLSGNFLEVGKYKGVLISDTMSGSFSSSAGSISLNGITPKTTGNIAYTDGYLLINNIKRADAIVAIPTLTLHNVSTGTGYDNNSTAKTTTTVAKSLIGEAEGPGLNMDFKYIKLDGRIANSITGATAAQISALDTAYNTYNSIFKTSTLLSSVKTDQNAQLVYNYTVADDWTDGRKVTYGAEVSMTSGCEYPGQEEKYFGSEIYTNPKSQADGTALYDFSGFRPYVATHYSATSPTSLYNRDLKVNVVAKGLTEGCGTYNDPYIISEKSQLINIAEYLSLTGNKVKASTLGKVNLPLVKPTSMTSGDRWCTDKDGDDYHGLYTINTSTDTFTAPTGGANWSNADVQSYLASAYYKVTTNIPIDSADGFKGLGGTTAGTAFRGVIVGQPTTTIVEGVSTTSYPTITVSGNNPFINVSNGCVVKDLNIAVNSDITREQVNNTQANAYFDYAYDNVNSDSNVCKFYGGVIGEIMGGDNIIDNTYVTFGSKTVTLSGTSGTIVPVGGYVGVVVFGGLIFKNMDARKTTLSATGLKVYYKDSSDVLHDDNNLADDTTAAKAAIYVNPLVGRVINGYAVNETGGNAKDASGNTVQQYSVTEKGKYHDDAETTRTGTQHTLKNGTKHYSVADLDPYYGKTAEQWNALTDAQKNALMLDVSTVPVDTANDGNIDVPNAQALFVLSLITQSCAGTATTVNGTAAHNEKTVETYRTTDPETGDITIYKTKTVTDVYSPCDYTNSLSYGTNSTVYGMSHNAAYSDVGTSGSSSSDYDTYINGDTASNAALPYIIRYYTVGGSDTTTSTDTSTTTTSASSEGRIDLFDGSLDDLDGKELYIHGTGRNNEDCYLDVKHIITASSATGPTAIVLQSFSNLPQSNATKVIFTKVGTTGNYYTISYSDGGVDKYLAFNGTSRNLSVSTTPYSFTIVKNNNGKWDIGHTTATSTNNYLNVRNETNFVGQGSGNLTFYEEIAGSPINTTTITTTNTTETTINYPARCVTSTLGYYDINLASGVSYQLPDSFRGLGCVGIYDQYSNENNNGTVVQGKNNQFSIKLNSFDGKNDTIDVDIYLNKYLSDNYFNKLHKGTNQNLSLNTTNYAIDAKTEEHGIGLFDSVIPKGTTTDGTTATISDFTLSGSVKTAVFSNTYATTNQQQYLGNNGNMLWHSTGGVVGWTTQRSGMNFEKINLSNLAIEGSDYIGGLLAVGAAVQSDVYKVVISECNAYDISLKMTGSIKDGSNRPFNAMGTFVGKYKEGKVIVYGTSAKENNTDTTRYSTVSIKKYEFGDENQVYYIACGGIVGFSGHGFECYDMKVTSSDGLSEPIRVGYQLCGSAGGICALIQPHTENSDTGLAVFKNCTVQNINVYGKAAGGIYGGKWNNNWVVQSLTLENCQVKGDSTNHNTVISNGATAYSHKDYTFESCAGGLVGYGVVYKAGSTENPQNITISDCLVENYDISAPTGYYAGGFIGYADTRNDSATFYIYNSSVENCILGQGGTSTDYCGGAIGGVASKTANKMLGYNIKLDTVTSSNTNRVGAWIGRLKDSTTTIQFTGVGVYGNSFEKNVGEGAAITSFVYADYEGTCESMTSSNAGYSTFNASSETNVVMPKYPYVNVNPQSALGSDEIISSDGAVLYSSDVTGFTGTGKNTMAARIYSEKDSSGTTKQYYETYVDDDIIEGSGVKISDYMNRSRTAEGDRISTFATERGMSETDLTTAGFDDFAVLVIATADETETTDLINRYIQLVTNTTTDYAAGSEDGYFNVDIQTCEYEDGSFSIDTGATNHGITNNSGAFQLNNDYADSLEGTFTLLDVQFMDPMSPVVKNETGEITDAGKIAYHLYVPIYTVREMAVKFYVSAKTGAYSVAYPGTNQYWSLISECITEQTNTPDKFSKRQHADTLNTWITQYIRYEYSAYDIKALLNAGNVKWNYNKTIDLETITNGTDKKRLPNGTYMVLVDPNGNSDQVYYTTVNSSNLTDYTVPDATDGTKDCWRVPLTAFKAEDYDGNDDNNPSFSVPTINDVIASSIVYTPNTLGTGMYQRLTPTDEERENENFDFDVYTIENGVKQYYEFRNAKNGNADLDISSSVYEDYYISVKVPGTAVAVSTDVYYYKIKIPSTRLQLGDIVGSNLSPKTAGLAQQNQFQMLIADLFDQEGNMTIKPDVQQITTTNHTIKANLSTVVTPKNSTAIYYLNGDEFFHSFYITLIRTSSNGIESDIKALSASDITATYKINDGTAAACDSVDLNLESNYINVHTTSAAQSSTLISHLRTNGSFTINADVEMEFDPDELQDEFPKRSAGEEYGVNVRAASNIAYESSALVNTSMTYAYPTDGHNYYIETVKRATLTYGPKADEIDTIYDEIGYNSKNQTTLGVNGLSANEASRTDMPVNTEAFYNVQSVSDSDLTGAKVLKLTLKLEKKTDSSGSPVPGVDYVPITSIQNYINGSITFKSKNAVATAAATGSTIVVYLNVDDCDYSGKLFDIDILFNAKSGGNFIEYANYKVDLKAELYRTAIIEGGVITGVDNESIITSSPAENYLIYTNAKICPEFIQIQQEEGDP